MPAKSKIVYDGDAFSLKKVQDYTEGVYFVFTQGLCSINLTYDEMEILFDILEKEMRKRYKYLGKDWHDERHGDKKPFRRKDVSSP